MTALIIAGWATAGVSVVATVGIVCWGVRADAPYVADAVR